MTHAGEDSMKRGLLKLDVWEEKFQKSNLKNQST